MRSLKYYTNNKYISFAFILAFLSFFSLLCLFIWFITAILSGSRRRGSIFWETYIPGLINRIVNFHIRRGSLSWGQDGCLAYGCGSLVVVVEAATSQSLQVHIIALGTAVSSTEIWINYSSYRTYVGIPLNTYAQGRRIINYYPFSHPYPFLYCHC